MRKNSVKKPIQKLIFIIAAVAVYFLAAECFLRIFAPLYSPSLRAFVKEEAYRGAQSALRVSRWTQIILSPDEFKRHIDVVAVGDSVVFGSLVKESELWTTLLEKKTGLGVLNLGVGSQGPCAYNYMLQVGLRRLPNPPSVVLYTIFANDITEGTCPPDSHYSGLFIWEDNYRRNFKLRLRRIREQVFQRSVLYQLIKRMLTFKHLVAGERFKPIFFKDDNMEFAFAPASYWKKHLDLSDGHVAEEFERTLDKIETARKFVAERGSEFIVVLMPFKEQVYVPQLVKKGLLSPNAYDTFYDSLYDKLFLRADKIGIKTIDLRPPFREAARKGMKLYWTLDGHLTPEGNNLTASILAKMLKK